MSRIEYNLVLPQNYLGSGSILDRSLPTEVFLRTYTALHPKRVYPKAERTIEFIPRTGEMWTNRPVNRGKAENYPMPPVCSRKSIASR